MIFHKYKNYHFTLKKKKLLILYSQVINKPPREGKGEKKLSLTNLAAQMCESNLRKINVTIIHINLKRDLTCMIRLACTI